MSFLCATKFNFSRHRISLQTMSKRSASPALGRSGKRQHLIRQSLRIQFRFQRAPISGEDADEIISPREPCSQTQTIWVDKDGPRNSAHARSITDRGIAEDRAVLIQLDSNNTALLRDIKIGAVKLNHEPVTLRGVPPFIAPGVWGEDLLCGSEPGVGVAPSTTTLCIGDVFAVKRRPRSRGEGMPNSPAVSALRLQLSSPRRPGEKVDATFGGNSGPDGVRAHTARTGLAGFFCRVLAPGSLVDGDILEVVERPNPQWSIERVSRLLYGMEGVCDDGFQLPGAKNGGATAVKEKWQGSEEELRELANLKELAGVEWRDEFAAMLAATEAGWGCSVM